MNRDEGAGRRAAVGHCLHDQRGFEAAKADAAAFLADVDGAEAELRGHADRVARENVLLVPFRGEWGDRVGDGRADETFKALRSPVITGEGFQAWLRVVRAILS